MLVDLFTTKPLQGILLKNFRAVVLGNANTDILNAAIAKPIEEHVGKGQPSTLNASVHAYGTVAQHHGTKYASPWSGIVKQKVRNKVKMHLTIPNNVSRDHSLETIPLMSCKI